MPSCGHAGWPSARTKWRKFSSGTTALTPGVEVFSRKRPNDTSTPARIANCSGIVSAETNVATMIDVSPRLVRTTRTISLRSIRLAAVKIRMPASAARGRYAASGAAASVINSSQTPLLAAARGVRPPASRLVAERSHEPVHAKPENRPLATLARPCPTNSWLMSSRSLLRAASVRAIDIDSTSPMAATATAPGASRQISARFTSGRCAMGGSERGMAPSTFTPCVSRCSIAVAADAAAIATKAPGTRGPPRLNISMISSAPTATRTLGQCVWWICRISMRTVRPASGVLGMSRRNTWRISFRPMSTPAPAANPTMTLSATKCTSTPRRARPRVRRSTPTITAR